MALPVGAVDPWSAGIMGATSVATAAMEKPSQTQNAAYAASFDNSGFVVNIGAGSATGATSSTLGLTQKQLLLAGLAVAFYFMRKK